MAIFTFQAAWNDFLAPLIFLLDQALYTFRLGLSLFRGAYDVQWAYLMASSLVVTLPVIVLFFLPSAHSSKTWGLRVPKYKLPCSLLGEPGHFQYIIS